MSITDDVARANLGADLIAPADNLTPGERAMVAALNTNAARAAELEDLKTSLAVERAAHEATRAELARVTEELTTYQSIELSNDLLRGDVDDERAKVARLCAAIQAMVDRDGLRGRDDVGDARDVLLQALADTAPDAPAVLAPQPAPLCGEAAGVEVWPSVIARMEKSGLGTPELIALMRARDAQGRAKYGEPLRVWNGRDARIDALQEALDLVAYLEQLRLRCVSMSDDAGSAVMAIGFGVMQAQAIATAETLMVADGLIADGGAMKHTPRGFAVYGKVKDDRGIITRIQRSSAMGPARCWLFVDDLDGFYSDGKPAPHLSRAEARRVAKALLRFAEGEE